MSDAIASISPTTLLSPPLLRRAGAALAPPACFSCCSEQFYGEFSNSGSCSRLSPLDIGAFFFFFFLHFSPPQQWLGNLTPPFKRSCQLVPHLRRHPPAGKRFSLSKRIQSTGMVFTPFPLSACFLSSLLSSGSSAISLLGSCFSLPGSELSSPSWPPAWPSCFPDPVFRQG